jgi:hypothetical protein
MRLDASIFLFVLLSCSALAYSQDKRANDISTVYAEGKINGTEYKNDYFGLTLTAEPGHFVHGDFISSEGKRARLVVVQDNSSNFEDKFEIAVLADSLAANPLIHAPEQYVRSVRHQLEKEGMDTDKAETTLQVSGLPFVQAILKGNDGGHMHYRAIYTTFLNGYIFSLDVSAPNPEKIALVVKRAVKLSGGS